MQGCFLLHQIPGQLLIHNLIGIDQKDPIVLGPLNPKGTLLGITRPRIDEYPAAQGFGDLSGIILAASIDHDYLVREGCTGLDRLGNPDFVILRDNDDGYPVIYRYARHMVHYRGPPFVLNR
ncbi:hypothetical protein D1872_299490 [compost metagenome]